MAADDYERVLAETRAQWWRLDARRPETRGGRIAETASEAAAGRRANERPR